MTLLRRDAAFLLNSMVIVSAGACSEGHASPAASSSSLSTSSGTSTTTSASGGGADAAPPGWAPVAGLEVCNAEYLVDPSVWPKPIWTSCGTGCQAAVTGETEAPAAERYSCGAIGTDDEIYYRTSSISTTIRMDVLRRLSDGAVLGAIRTSRSCFVTSPKRGAPFLFEWFDSTFLHHARFFRSDESIFDERDFTFTTSPASVGWFSSRTRWGLIDDSRIRVATSDQEAALYDIFSGQGTQAELRASDDAVAWIDPLMTPIALRMWTKASGTAQVPLQKSVTKVALSNSTLAFMEVEGPGIYEGVYEKAQLFWAPMPFDPSGAGIVAGPDVSSTASGSAELDVGGEYLAFSAVTPVRSAMGVYVLRRSSGKSWFIPAPAGRFGLLMAMSPSEMLLGELDLNQSTNAIVRYLRISFDSLDALSGGWLTP